MLVLKLEFWPQGDKARAEEIGRMTVALLRTSEDGKLGDYEVEIFDKETRVVKSWTDSHQRTRHGAWELIRLAFAGIGGRIRRAEDVSKVEQP